MYPLFKAFRQLSCALGIFGILLLTTGIASAASSEWWESEYGAVRLISAADSVGQQGITPLGLQFTMKPGWKVYWRNPGDAGYPPRLNWSGSQNLKSTTIKWPLPERFEILGLETLGYKKEVVFPVDLEVSDASKATELKLAVDYLTCSEICVPLQANLKLSLPTGDGVPSTFVHLVNKYRSMVPGVQTRDDIPVQGLSVTKLGIVGDGKKPNLWLRARSVTPMNKPGLYVEGPIDFIFKEPNIKLSADKLSIVAKVPVDGQYADGTLPGKPITITLLDSGRAVERTFAAEKLAEPIDSSGMTPTGNAIAEGGKAASGGTGIWIMLGFALIGGMILNLMPCVLPVVCMKTLGVIKHGGGETGVVRLSFLATAAGIFVSFLALAGVLILLKMSGVAVGWGIQFQQTWFLVSMILIITLFACNLWGFFEIALPQWIANTGAQTSHVQGLGGHFLSGVLATLLATPCSAPFLGTAVGFALSRGALEISAIFALLGIGMSVPYLIVAAKPTLATMLPKPGPWMVTLRKVLGFALAGTVVWLLSVVVAQSGLEGAMAIGGLMVAVCVILFLAHGGKFVKGRTAWIGVATLTALAYILPGQFTPAKAVVVDDGIWQNFDQNTIPQLVGDGKLVFVDVTADWCITCQVNKTLVFGDEAVAERLAAKNMVAMKADWTKPSDVISAYLAGFGRYGIPFNIVYGPKAPAGIALPEVMTPSMVIEAMEKAGS